MKCKNHYQKTKDFFRVSAIERQGYYDARFGTPLRHNIWQLRIRKMVLAALDKLLQCDSNILKIIDVGCGRGDFTIEIAKRYPQLSRIWGCDFSKENLTIACKDAESSEKISFLETDLLNIPCEDNSFDLALCINVLHHIHKNDLARALSELARITKRYLVMEIKNNDNFYMRYMHPRYFGGTRVYPTSIKEVNCLLKIHSFQSMKQKGIFLFNWLSPLLVLVYSDQDKENEISHHSCR